MKSLILKYKAISITIFTVYFFIVLTGCSKSAGGSSPTPTPTPTPEASLVFSINPDPGGTIFAALGSTHDIAINIISTLPSAGVTADIVVTKDLDNSSVFSQTLSATNANFTATIKNLVGGIVCTATITLTSKSTLSNKAIKTFKIARK